jgi:hypothetical protein
VGHPVALDLGVRRGDPPVIAHPWAAQPASILSIFTRMLGEGRSRGGIGEVAMEGRGGGEGRS